MSLTRAGPEVFRLTPPVVLWWIWLAFAVANLVDLAVQGWPGHASLVVGAIVLLITGLAYALALRPHVVAGEAGLTIVNPFRDHHVPWAAIQRVDVGDWVRVHHTADGSPAAERDKPGKAIECWALYVSASAKRREARGAPPPMWTRSPQPGASLARRAGARQPDELARLPAEARHLASLPPAKAIAARLDTRAARERARQPRPADLGQVTAQVTAGWAWWPLAAVAAPAAALLIALLG